MSHRHTPTGARKARRPNAVALGLLALLALAACGDGGSGGTDLASLPPFCQEVLPRVDAFMSQFEQPEGERYGGTAVLASIGEFPNGMNGLVSSDYFGNEHQRKLNLTTLIRYDADLEPVPYLAESWEFNEDATELTFHLRDGVFWHDGTPTTAYDVEFSYLRWTEPQTVYPNVARWDRYVGGPDGVEVVDSLTVRFRLEPQAEPLDAWQYSVIMPRHLLEDVPMGELAQHPYGSRCPVGNGPFVFESHDADERWSWVRNPAFPEALGGPPHLERYVYRVIPEPTTLLTELLTESIDVMSGVSPDQGPRIEAVDNLELYASDFPQYDFVIWNSRTPELSDVRVRRALTLGTNREEMVQAIQQGYGVVANAGVPPFHWAYMEGIEDSLGYDPDRAATLLDEAGWVDRDDDGIRENANGEPLSIQLKYNLGNDRREDVAQIMQAQLQEVGIEIVPQVLEWATMNEQLDPPNREFEGAVFGFVVGFKIEETEVFHSRSVDRPFGMSGTQDPEIDVLLDTLQVIVEREEAMPFWEDYQNRIMEVQPWTYLWHADRLTGVNRRLRDVEIDARGDWVSVADWWIPENLR